MMELWESFALEFNFSALRCHEGMKFEGEKQQATCRADGKVTHQLLDSTAGESKQMLRKVMRFSTPTLTLHLNWPL